MIQEYSTILGGIVVPITLFFIETLLKKVNKGEQQYSHKLVKLQSAFAKEKYESSFSRLNYMIVGIILLICLFIYVLLNILMLKSAKFELFLYYISIILMGVIAYFTRKKVYMMIILDKYSGISWWIVVVNIVIYTTSYILMSVLLKIDFAEFIIPNSDLLLMLYNFICIMISLPLYLFSQQKRFMRIQAHRTNCRIEIKNDSQSPEIIEGSSIIDFKEYLWRSFTQKTTRPAWGFLRRIS